MFTKILNLGLCDLIKKMLLAITLIFSLSKLNAQINDQVKLTTQLGFLVESASESAGFFINAEPKLKLTENAFMGLRMTIIFNPHKINIHNPQQFFYNPRNDNGGVSLVPTFDYYMTVNNLRPFIGLGAGPYMISRYIDITPRAGDFFEATIKRQFGVLFRGGVESHNLRIGLEYNLISKADINEPNGQTIGIVDNSYLGLTIGCLLIGRKPRKK